MKAFWIALTVLILLIGGAVGLSIAAQERVDGYLRDVPPEDTSLDTAVHELSEIEKRVEDDRLLLGALFSHQRIDELLGSLARAGAAARAEEKGEYALLRAELISFLESLARDLRPSLSDIF